MRTKQLRRIGPDGVEYVIALWGDERTPFATLVGVNVRWGQEDKSYKVLRFSDDLLFSVQDSLRQTRDQVLSQVADVALSLVLDQVSAGDHGTSDDTFTRADLEKLAPRFAPQRMCVHQQPDGQWLKCLLSANDDPNRGRIIQAACDQCTVPTLWELCDRLIVETWSTVAGDYGSRLVTVLCHMAHPVASCEECAKRPCKDYVPKLVEAEPIPTADTGGDVFRQTQVRVEVRLAVVGPDALKALKAASDVAHQQPFSSERASHVAVSCRRALRYLADALYPPADREIDGHKLGPEEFINRLWQFAKENPAPVSKDSGPARVEALGQRIEGLHSRSCKGVHADLDVQEAHQCIFEMYGVIGELISRLPSAE